MSLDSIVVNLPHSYQSMTAAKGLRATKNRDPNKVAITHGNKSRTYKDLSARVDRLTAAAITDLKLKKGENVAIVARNSIEYVEVVCGLPDAGAAVATVNPRLTAPEIEAICNDAHARVVFYDDASAEAVLGAAFDSVERTVHLGDEYETLVKDAATPDAYPDIQEWDPWTIPYTSGTTGKPKGVVLPQRSRLLAFYQMAQEFGCYGPEDRFLGTTPMNHGAGIAFPLAAIMSGGFTEVLDRFDPEAYSHPSFASAADLKRPSYMTQADWVTSSGSKITLNMRGGYKIEADVGTGLAKLPGSAKPVKFSFHRSMHDANGKLMKIPPKIVEGAKYHLIQSNLPAFLGGRTYTVPAGGKTIAQIAAIHGANRLALAQTSGREDDEMLAEGEVVEIPSRGYQVVRAWFFMADEVFQSLLIQGFLMENLDPKLFSPVYLSPWGKVYRVLR